MEFYLIPKWDEWRSEFVHEGDDLVKHLTEFKGSYGILIMKAHAKNTNADSSDYLYKKFLFVDSRYTIQAKNECLNVKVLDLMYWKKFLIDNAEKIILDPKLWNPKEIEVFKDKKIILYKNLIDKFWPNRPKKPQYQINKMDKFIDHTEDKIKKISVFLEQENADALLVSHNESLSWLVNERSFDRPYNHAIERYGLVMKNKKIITSETPSKLLKYSKNIIVDESASLYIQKLFKNARVTSSPITLLKACKSKNEIKGFINAHKQDAQAMKLFLDWLENESNNITEKDAEEKILELRKKQKDFISPSFPTISATGPNGAIVHYRANNHSNRKLQKGDIYLIDSGGHYHGGTTDITRTVMYQNQEADPEIKKRYTQVLKGHIALASSVFPKNTTGAQLDILARQFLWKDRHDYGHGTGHGVGACLNVHEGPQNISSKGTTPLMPGMIVSIEPGFYKENAYGIRLENLYHVTTSGSSKDWLQFENLTYVPLADARLVDTSMLTEADQFWIAENFGYL